MNHQQLAFRRKIIYLAIMAALLLPLSLLGLPKRDRSAQGGPVLANMREQSGLAQRSLGDVDTKSETMKFALVGFRGVASTILWNQAHEHKKKENWTALHSVLENIGQLQPNFVNVWRYQGWNLSYNVSAEWDDYRDRYKWVLTGISYLNKGQEYNRYQTRLLWDEGWFTGNKIGRSDEYRQFRRLFQRKEWFADESNPNDLGYRLPPRYKEAAVPDNWLCAKESFLEAISYADNQNVPLQGIAEEIYRSEPAKSQMRYAQAIIEEGTFGERAKSTWKQAGREWEELGNHPFEQIGDVVITINKYDTFMAEAKELAKQLDDLSASDSSGKTVTGHSVRVRLEEEQKQKLDQKLRAILDKPDKDRTDAERLQAADAVRRIAMAVDDAAVANAMPESAREKARALVAQMKERLDLARKADLHRNILNYAFWKIRCEAGAADDAVDAAELQYNAHQAMRKDPASSAGVELYEKAFAKWRRVLDRYPDLVSDGDVGDDIVEEIRVYRRALGLLERPFDKKTFILKDVIEARNPSPPIE
jgi:hypothetical protein